MNSMTGFGRAGRRDRRFDIEVEARSVNHRFLSLKVSAPDALARYAGELERLVRAQLARGSVTVSVTLKACAEAEPPLPTPARVRKVYRSLDAIRRSLGLKGEIPFEALLAVPRLWEPSNHESEHAEAAWPLVKRLVLQATREMLKMRAREGETIQRDVAMRLDTIADRLRRIRERAPTVLVTYQRRLDERIGALLAQKGLEISKQDLAKEIAVYADRCDISEEAQRLGAHVESFRRIVKGGGQIGRRLDFLTQEMVREANTLSSKAGDSEISGLAVEIKAELEKIKEQSENVE